MIGGKVIEVRSEGDKTRLWCIDSGGQDELAVYVKTTAELPACGDDIWWQGREVMWTPADRRFTDKHLERIGYSFDPSRTETNI